MSRSITSLPPRRGRPITLPLLPLVVLLAVAFLALPTAASSGDRNPTFQHCLRGCQLTYCDPSQPPISPWLRMAGWSCVDNCKYSCAHSFTDNIRAGGRWHQCEYEHAEEGRLGVKWEESDVGGSGQEGTRQQGGWHGGEARRDDRMGKWKR